MAPAKRTPIESLLERGGQTRIELLRYCVMSVVMEPVFVFLAREYRLRPSHHGAIALYDAFCAPRAPARIVASSALPPRDRRMTGAIDVLRVQWQQMRQAPPPEQRVPVTPPPRSLFDPVVQALGKDRRGPLARLGRRYDPSKAPIENLAGGRATPGQRAFVENVWKRIVRPELVAAGFWRIATIE